MVHVRGNFTFFFEKIRIFCSASPTLYNIIITVITSLGVEISVVLS